MAKRGVWTALVTPFTQARGGTPQIDLEAFKKIIRDQREAKVAGVIPCGTTGESPTLSIEEKKTLIKTALEELRGSGVGVIAGTGSNNTAETIELSRWASEQGVEGVLIVTPYYNKPTQAGLEAHFLAIADQVKCEVMLYNVPGRTGISLTAETIVKLAAHPRVRSLKEATANTAFTSEILDQLHLSKRNMDVFSGDDATFLPLLSIGAVGVVSVASNLFPRAMVAIQAAAEQGQPVKAQEIHRKYYPLFRDLFIESNPSPVKAALHFAGWCESEVRLPLVQMTSPNLEKLKSTLKHSEVQEGNRSPL